MDGLDRRAFLKGLGASPVAISGFVSTGLYPGLWAAKTADEILLDLQVGLEYFMRSPRFPAIPAPTDIIGNHIALVDGRRAL
jgi:acyl dehydratase